MATERFNQPGQPVPTGEDALETLVGVGYSTLRDDNSLVLNLTTTNLDTISWPERCEIN